MEAASTNQEGELVTLVQQPQLALSAQRDGLLLQDARHSKLVTATIGPVHLRVCDSRSNQPQLHVPGEP
jgi:hypothetical protein